MNLLLVYRLAIQSSYVDNVEEEADDERFDTVQWWVTADRAWRIRTFAIDDDVHLHQVPGPVAAEALRANTRKNYTDVIDEAFEVVLPDLQDRDAIAAAMGAHGGADTLEVDRKGARFAFWNPRGVTFTTKSEPE